MDEKITSRDNPKVKYACKLATAPASGAARAGFSRRGANSAPSWPKARRWSSCSIPPQPPKSARNWPACPGSTFWWRSTCPKAGRRARPAGGVRGVSVPRSILWTRCGAGDGIWPSNGCRTPATWAPSSAAQPPLASTGVILSEGCASPYAPKTLRASMGAAVRVPVIETGPLPPALARLRQLGIRCLAAALEHSEPLGPVPAAHPGGVCVVVGSEGQGLEGDTIAACDAAVRIPMHRPCGELERRHRRQHPVVAFPGGRSMSRSIDTVEKARQAGATEADIQLCWLWLAYVLGPAHPRARNLLRWYGADPITVWRSRNSEEFGRMLGGGARQQERLRDTERALAVCRRRLDQCSRQGIAILPYGSPDYPRSLLDLPDPPMVLYCIGTRPGSTPAAWWGWWAAAIRTSTACGPPPSWAGSWPGRARSSSAAWPPAWTAPAIRRRWTRRPPPSGSRGCPSTSPIPRAPSSCAARRSSMAAWWASTPPVRTAWARTAFCCATA